MRYILNAKPRFIGVLFCLFFFSMAETRGQELQSSQELPQAESSSARSARVQPGLGISGFYPSEIQSQLNSVRQDSIRPLELEFPEQKKQKEQKQQDLMSVDATDSAAKSETPFRPLTSASSPLLEAPETTEATEAQASASARSLLPEPESKTTKPVKEAIVAEKQASAGQALQAAALPQKPNELQGKPQAEQKEGAAKTIPQATAQTTPQATAPVTAKAMPKAAPKVQPQKKLAAGLPQTNKAKPHSVSPQMHSPTKANVAKSGLSKTQNSAKQGISISKTMPFGDPFSLSLHGLIWTYIPGLSEYPAEPKFERSLGNLETSFRFTFPEPGRYLLTFSRQYPSSGSLEYYSAEIMVQGDTGAAPQAAQELVLAAKPRIVPKTSAPKANAPKMSSNDDINYRITSQVISDIREQLDNGELDSAYNTLHDWPKTEKGDIYDSAARAFLDAGMNSQAAEMWQRNTSLDGELRKKAIVGIVRASTQDSNGKDSKKLLEWLPQFVLLAKSQVSSSAPASIRTEDFTAIHQALKDSELEVSHETLGKNTKAILDFYQTYIELYPEDRNSPEILYNMASHYENPGAMQDLRHARQLYMEIKSKYPVARYSQLAQERIDYLNRQFFYVR